MGFGLGPAQLLLVVGGQMGCRFSLPLSLSLNSPFPFKNKTEKDKEKKEKLGMESGHEDNFLEVAKMCLFREK